MPVQGLTYNQIAARVCALGGHANSAVNVSLIQSLLDVALQRVMSTRQWQFREMMFTRAVLPGDTGVATESTLIEDVETVECVDSTGFISEMIWLPMTEFRAKRRELQGTTGTPVYWTHYGEPNVFLGADDILFLPTADANYTLNVWNYQGQLWNSSSTVAIVPTRFCDTIIWAAVSSWAIRERDMSTFQMAEQAYEKAIRRAITAEGRRQKGQTEEVVRSGIYDNLDTWYMDTWAD